MGGSMAGAVDIATEAAGPVIGGGLGLWGTLRFIRWLVEFICKRQDIRTGRLDDRERNLEARFNARLAHVEQELELYREATARLVQRVAEVFPADPVLRDVAEILRKAIPFDNMDADLERLVRQARRSGE
jgi:hypothetical protein